MGDYKELEEKEGEPPKDLVEETLLEAQAIPRAKKRGSKIWLMLIAISFVTLALAGSLYFIFGGDFTTALKRIQQMAGLSTKGKQDPQDPGTKKLSLYGISGKFMPGKDGKNLFVINGNVKNGYSDKRSHILVRANLIDAKGNVLKSKTAYAGNPITEPEIKTLTYAELEKIMNNPDGKDNANIGILPKESRPFTIIIDEIPENVSEFTVQVVSSKPAQ